MITCDICPDSACCKDVTVEIDEPDTLEDWDEIRWMVAHDKVAVYMDQEDDWVVEFKTPCTNIDNKGKCLVYGKRPKTCIEHPLDSCIYNGEGKVEQIRFETMDQVEEHVKKHVIPKLQKEMKGQQNQLDNWPPKH